ncbi:MAG TPA: hypothetical protein VGF55_07750 [Gemmataceae bacterium]|jgi:hypothetical protein
MLVPSVVLIGVAVILVLAVRRVAPARPRAALAVAAGGVCCFALGLSAGGTLERAERLEAAAGLPLSVDDDEQALLRQLFPDGAIRTAPPDDRTVCHDWTFGGTRYTDGCPVATLLADYRPVTHPRPGDVIVYWGPAREAVHSGVVRAVGRSGFVVVESKWGHLGRYLHLTGISRFPSAFSYYRRNRADARRAS